jgi:hypothetical protein
VTPTLKRIHALLDGVWAGHTGYAALDFEELAEGFAGLLGIMTERHLTFLVDRATGRDVGLAFGFPDYARPERPPWRFVPHTVAVLPETRRTGGSHLIVAQLFKDVHGEGYQQAVIALVDEDFRWFGKVVKPTRTYALYARPVSLTTPV